MKGAVSSECLRNKCRQYVRFSTMSFDVFDALLCTNIVKVLKQSENVWVTTFTRTCS